MNFNCSISNIIRVKLSRHGRFVDPFFKSKPQHTVQTGYPVPKALRTLPSPLALLKFITDTNCHFGPEIQTKSPLSLLTMGMYRRELETIKS